MKKLFFLIAFAGVMSACTLTTESEDCACRLNGSDQEYDVYDQEDCSSLNNDDQTCRVK